MFTCVYEFQAMAENDLGMKGAYRQRWNKYVDKFVDCYDVLVFVPFCGWVTYATGGDSYYGWLKAMEKWEKENLSV